VKFHCTDKKQGEEVLINSAPNKLAKTRCLSRCAHIEAGSREVQRRVGITGIDYRR
jgi:hypothetical protein